MAGKRKRQGKGESKTSPRLVKAKQKQARAVDLRLAGKSYAAIAKELGYANKSSAYKAVKTALESQTETSVDEYRRVQNARLNEIHQALWTAVNEEPPEDQDEKARQRWEQERLRAIGLIHKNMERRARLLGLDAPTKQEKTVQGKDGGPLEIVSETTVDLSNCSMEDLKKLEAMLDEN